MRIRSQRLSIAAIVSTLIALCWISLSSAAAQSTPQGTALIPEPAGVISAVLADLSSKIGQTLTRQNVQGYTWQQVQFPDAALGCPKTGVNYTQGTVSGYQVIVTTRDNHIYDYRTTLDAAVIILCQPNGPATISVTVTPIPPTGSPSGVAAPGTVTVYTNPIAFAGTDGNVYIAQPNSGPITPITGDAAGAAQNTYPFHVQNRVYTDLHWSPDGTKLLFIDQMSGAIDVVQSGKAVQTIAHTQTFQLPPVWSTDSQSVIYTQAVSNPPPSSTNQVPFTVYTAKLDGSQPVAGGQVMAGVGCGGGTSSVLMRTYDQETDSLGGNGPFFAATPAGIVYSTACTGQGLALLNTNGQPGWNHPDLARAALSPDGTQLAAIQYSSAHKITGLVKVDVATGTETPLVTQPNVDQVGWSGDNQLVLFSTRQLLAQLPIPASAPLGSVVFAPWPPDGEDATQNTVGLWKISAAGGQAQSIYQSAGYAIGVIAGTGDNQTAAISTIGSFKPVFDALQANQPQAAVQALFPLPQIQLVSLNTPGVIKLAQGGQPAAAHGTFNAVAVGVQGAILPTIPAGTVTPPALIVGGNALVTATGAVLNVRDSPSASGKIVQQIEYGATVKIIGGPVSAGGYRWWQVQLANGMVGWAIDQYTDNTGTTNTLTPQ